MNAPAPIAPIAAAAGGRLYHFPLPLFTIVMGLIGVAMAWATAHRVAAGVPLGISVVLRWMATVLYAVLLAGYVLKWLRHPGAVAKELANPVRRTLFAGIPIGLVLLGTAWAEAAPDWASWVWAVGAAANIAFTLAIVSSWLFRPHHHDIRHANPAWFVPVVGNMVVPIAGAGFAPPEISWFFFSVGFTFWIVLKTIVIYRLVFHEAMPERLTPTLFILMAPPAVGFLAYTALTGAPDAFARCLYYVSLFMGMLLLCNARRFLRLPFSLAAWAYSFPLAALTVASFRMGMATGYSLFTWLAGLLLTLLSMVIGVLLVNTMVAAVSGKIFVPME
jgi:tellurite resistance protein